MIPVSAARTWPWPGTPTFTSGTGRRQLNTSKRPSVTLLQAIPSRQVWYGWFLCGIGKTNEALIHFQAAEEIDGSDVTVNQFYGEVLFYSRRWTEAIQRLMKADSMPDKQENPKHLTWFLLWQDRTNEAIEKWVDALCVRRRHGFPI